MDIKIDSPRLCGCKGCRTCLICEKELNLEEKPYISDYEVRLNIQNKCSV